MRAEQFDDATQTLPHIQDPQHYKSSHQLQVLEGSNNIGRTRPCLIPHFPSSFQPVLVTKRSTSYRAPHTLRVLMYGSCISAFPICEFIFLEIASDPNLVKLGAILNN